MYYDDPDPKENEAFQQIRFVLEEYALESIYAQKVLDKYPPEYSQTKDPYIRSFRIVEDRKYNPKYGDHKTCECSHSYDRHFDSYDDMRAIGCKYCQCCEFKEQI